MQAAQLIGVAMQRQQAVADQVYGGLVAGTEQQDDVGRQLLIGELAALFLGLNQLRRQVVTGLAAAQLEQGAKILGRGEVAGAGGVDLLPRERHWIEQPPARACAHEEQLVLLLGDAQHLADHDHRQPVGKVGDQVHSALRCDAVDRLIDDLLDAWTHLIDPARRESLHHEAAQARVVGRIELQHPVPHAAVDRLLHHLRPEAPRHATHEILAEPLVAYCEADVGMPACHEEAQRRLVHRVLRAQAVVVGVGVGDHRRRHRIEERLRLGGLKRLIHGAPPSAGTTWAALLPGTLGKVPARANTSHGRPSLHAARRSFHAVGCLI